MKSRSDFWLNLHHLAHDLEQEGDNDNERAERLREILQSLSAPTRAVYLANLTMVSEALVELQAQCRME